MPYIKREQREQYNELIAELAKRIPQDLQQRAGHMNFIVSSLINEVYGKEMRYADHNEVIGVLSCIQQEFYRRHTVPYEDLKIEKEGDLK